MIILHKGDITEAEVDALVNAANPTMLGGGGVDGAIHRAAGPRLKEACRQVRATSGVRCPFGEARITSAGELKARHVIHAVGPRYTRDPEPEKLLESAFRASLELALENECRSIAFPAISCGAYGYPIGEAAEIAVRVAREFEDKIDIHFYLFSNELLGTWSEALDGC